MARSLWGVSDPKVAGLRRTLSEKYQDDPQLAVTEDTAVLPKQGFRLIPDAGRSHGIVIS